MTSVRSSSDDVLSIEQDANALVAKLYLTCKQPDLAESAKALFDRLLRIIAQQATTLEHADVANDSAYLESVHKSAQALTSTTDFVTCEKLILSDAVDDRQRAISLLHKLLDLCVHAEGTISKPACQTKHVAVDWGSDKACPWYLAQRDHNVLLALVHGYRFIIEASNEDLQARDTTRLQTLRKVRGVELKAQLAGVLI